MKFTPEVMAALETLKSAAENDFERHRINILERDLTEPPKVEVIDDTHQKFDGRKYYPAKGSRGDIHFVSSSTYPLHRAVYSYYYGEIPDGYVIHHKDWNPYNNNIDNLQLLTRSAHKKIHNSAPCSDNNTKTVICKNCNKEFIVSKVLKKHFCCDKCRRAFYHEKEKIFVKSCQRCGKTFKTRTEKSRYCSLDCANNKGHND